MGKSKNVIKKPTFIFTKVNLWWDPACPFPLSLRDVKVLGLLSSSCFHSHSQQIRMCQSSLCNISALEYKECQPYEHIATSNLE